jgi:hypothetical protein
MSEEQKQPPAATRESLLRLRNMTPREPYEVPGLGRVWVYGDRHLDARLWLEASRKESPDGPDHYSDARAIVRSVRDEAGKPLFKAGDEMLIVEWPELVVQDLIKLYCKVNGLGPVADETIRKNFGTILTSGS